LLIQNSFTILAEKEGFAYMLQAAESLAGDSLRIPRASRAGGLLLSSKQKCPLARAFVFWREGKPNHGLKLAWDKGLRFL